MYQKSLKVSIPNDFVHPISALSSTWPCLWRFFWTFPPLLAKLITPSSEHELCILYRNTLETTESVSLPEAILVQSQVKAEQGTWDPEHVQTRAPSHTCCGNWGNYLNFVCPFVYVNGNNNNNLIQGCCATNRVSFPAWSVLSSTCCRVSVLWNDSSPWSAHLMSTLRHRGQARSVKNSGMRVSLVHWLSLNNDCFSTPLMLNAFRPKMYRANLF